MIQLIQIADDQNTDTSIVRLVGKGQDDLVELFTYLISESAPNRFFLQVATANRNLSRFSPNPFDTISLSQMLALIEDQGYEKDSIVANITYYDAKVEAILDEAGKPDTPYIRPTTGAINRLATTEEITRCLELPQVDGNAFRIGTLARSGEAEVAINPDANILNHHILVAGSTGSGKSHLLSNLAHAAAAMNRCIILFDHKPDHQNHREPNDDPDTPFPSSFSLKGKDPSKPSVHYWTLDESDPNTNTVGIGVRARELDPEILAGTIFYGQNEDNQAEIFAHIAANFASERSERNQDWTIHDLINYIRSKSNGELGSFLYGTNNRNSLHGATMSAVRRKMELPGRIPSFIDPRPSSNVFGQRRQTGDMNEIFKPGLNVIRISESNNRGYALFLTYLLQKAESLRADAIQQSTTDNSNPDLEIIIDEASDIFRANSRYLREAATGMLAEQIRKGRSLHTGYVISVQSAGDVPDNVRNNLNTTIIGRHRNMGVLREALPTARSEMLEQADRLNPGEMFVDMFGVRSLLLVQMDLSRSKLTVAQ